MHHQQNSFCALIDSVYVAAARLVKEANERRVKQKSHCNRKLDHSIPYEITKTVSVVLTSS